MNPRLENAPEREAVLNALRALAPGKNDLGEIADDILATAILSGDVFPFVKSDAFDKLEAALHRALAAERGLDPDSRKWLEIDGSDFSVRIEWLRKRVQKAQAGLDRTTGRKANMLEAGLAGAAIDAYEALTGKTAPYPDARGSEPNDLAAFATDIFRAFGTSREPVHYLRDEIERRRSVAKTG